MAVPTGGTDWRCRLAVPIGGTEWWCRYVAQVTALVRAVSRWFPLAAVMLVDSKCTERFPGHDAVAAHYGVEVSDCLLLDDVESNVADTEGCRAVLVDGKHGFRLSDLRKLTE